ncbi:Uncharacterized protein PTH_2171 [Pelotomaculum thermopropionicum SI]|uniref:SCP domain-containing protein n=1 Tax=Pelotomaculum thermopropionicum (strain DSM 13744 / JCM 10971 / SI) TaxID=370438 RepID=A5D088_PELTS|nr:Uncharacterized protein PTH_2171 [Pelotomaculum thermopropionicum SI]
MTKKITAVLLALALLLGGYMMLARKAEAATASQGKPTIFVYRAKVYKITFYTTNYRIYEYLKAKGYNVIYKGQLPEPAPAPAPAPQPQPQPTPAPEPAPKPQPQPEPAPTPAPQPTPQPSPSPAPAPTPSPILTADEQKMVDLVNQERVKAGLKPLVVDERLVKSARAKSQDMVDKNYFAHTSPSGVTPWDLMKAQGVTYRYAGENLAGNQTVERAHEALMNSPGHRENILNPNYTHIGIGIVRGGPYGAMFTQHFIGI